MLLMKPDGAAVWRTEITDAVGRAAARLFAIGPRLRRTAGSVGNAVIPASEALSADQQGKSIA